MPGRRRPPLILIAVLLLGLIALLASLQYRWLGQISAAERETTRTRLSAAATEFAHDFDRELTRAYLLFQGDPTRQGPDTPGEGLTAQFDKWQASARFPRLFKECFVFSPYETKQPQLQRFDPGARRLEPAQWPEDMSDWRERLKDESVSESPSAGTVFIRRIAPPIWSTVPALIVPRPVLSFREGPGERPPAPSFSYLVLVLDRDYIAREVLPSLAQRHFTPATAGADFRVAVVSRPDRRIVYQSSPAFSPGPDDRVDASADLLQVRTSDFATLASEVRRLTSFTATLHSRNPAARAEGRLLVREGAPMSIVMQPSNGPAALRGLAATARHAPPPSPGWRLLLVHPAGSLDAAVNTARRRNLFVSSSILAVLGASMALLVLSTRRAQTLARQQMEFVATVSHELRTPLAVIRSAAENLADGVVADEAQIKKYGELLRGEGRRLTEMVEQILEFSGLQSGRGLTLAPVSLDLLLHDIVESAETMTGQAGIGVEIDVQPDLPEVIGDEPALRRVFQNLIGNAIKYGGNGRWIGVRARRHGGDVEVTVADRGIGIPAADLGRIFEPFYRASEVVAAQIQGAGLGLSLVQRIVEAHGGRVTVKSTHGAGSEFAVRLRAASEEPESRRTSDRTAPTADEALPANATRPL